MEKPVAIIEITDSVVRLVIGNVVDSTPVVIYRVEKPISGIVSRAEILDLNKLTAVIASLKTIVDDEAKLKINITEATVIFPPLGFQIYTCDKSTSVVSQTNVIEHLDIQNVISMVQNESVPGGSEIVDIIPDLFVLEDGRQFLNPPLGQKSRILQLFAKVHTLPNRVVSDYKRAVEGAGIRVKRIMVAPYAACDYLKHADIEPKNFILVDMNDGMTSLTLVGALSPFSCGHFLLGKNDLVLKVANEFGIDEEKARGFIDLYGINERELSFEPVLFSMHRPDGSYRNVTPDDFNNVINDFFKEYFVQFDVAYATLLQGYSEEVKKLPIVFTGELSKLFGIKKLLKKKFSEAEEIYFPVPKTIGIRDTKFTNCVGALLINSRYRGSLSDQRAKTTQLDREESKD